MKLMIMLNVMVTDEDGQVMEESAKLQRQVKAWAQSLLTSDRCGEINRDGHQARGSNCRVFKLE
jgi:hypothetical protein